MDLRHAPVAKTEMLIRKPVAEVFGAFVDPAITTKFWFTKSSGKLEDGKEVRWDWEMYGVSTRVIVKAIEKYKRFSIDHAAGRQSFHTGGGTALRPRRQGCGAPMA